MRKTFVICGFCVFAFLLGSCETIDNITLAISSLFQTDSETTDDENSNDNRTSSQKEKSNKNKTSKIPAFLTYNIPADYTEAYSYRTNKPDARIQSYIKNKSVDSLRSSEPDKYIKTVCEKINELAQNDFEKAKMAHDVICVLIHYDAKNFWAGTIPEQSWQTVLKNKVAVCEGYSNLFLHFCTVLKLPCEKVTGYARGVGFDLTKESVDESNHAWNIVKINNEWYLVDSTWDSGHMNGRTSVQDYNTQWLFTKPEVFIYSHYPMDQRKQFLKPFLSPKEFLNLPYYRPIFFDYADKAFEGINSITKCEDSLKLEYIIKDGCKFTFSIKNSDGSEIKNRVHTTRNGVNESTILNFPKAGRYEIKVYYWTETAKQGWSCALFYAEASSGNSLKYPTLYSGGSKSAKLISPMYSPLKAGETIKFEVYVEDKQNVALIYNKTFIQLENNGEGLFTKEITIPQNIKKISVGLAKSAKSTYEYLAQWDVQ